MHGVDLAALLLFFICNSLRLRAMVLVLDTGMVGHA